ncbi:MAG: histidine kinase, partial [Gammaproteobacteria bacterium]|nr:histidine kinase [Gammaproteobacteria bacterium]NNJ72947.1 histidine kinase [Enterobacterales bacterium]
TTHTESIINQGFKHLIENEHALFWTLQLAGWGALFVVSSLTLTLFYNDPSMPYIAHNLVKAALGVLFTWPMRLAFAKVWGEHELKRVLVVLFVTLVMSILWTLIIIDLFQRMTGEFIEYFDYGGWFYSSIFIFMTWAASYHGIKYYFLLQDEHQRLLRIRAEQQHQLLKRSEAENQAKLAKLKFLSYQLNPHFLFNTLNSIYSLIGTDNTTKARDMLSQLSNFLRTTLNNSEDILIPLKQELDSVQSYLDIQKTRYGMRLFVDMNCNKSSMAARIPIFLLQPLVENSIKYAISKSLEGGVIRISSEVVGEKLVITVEDSGILTSSGRKSNTESMGIGLNNAQERLEVLYEDNFILKLTDSELGGVKVLIEIPYSEEKYE